MNLRSTVPLLVLLASAASALAAPYIPKSDTQVLERLPYKPSDPIARELSQLRAALRRDPRNLEAAVALAGRYYGMVGEEGDPRYLGYAQAALGPWWDMSTPPVEVQVLRASLRQFRHDFAGAVDDLTQILEREPGHVRARALRAIIHIVQARYTQARTDCQALAQVGNAPVGLGCEAMVDGLTGKAAPAYAALNAAVAKAADVAPSDMLWLQIRLAELAQRQGRDDLAEAHFKKALALGITDTFLLAAYADMLLDQKRHSDVAALLKDKSRSDVLLLRLMLAERGLGMPSARERESELAARYAAAQMRGEKVHQQEEARFALQVHNDAAKALVLAQENWQAQREPRDARIFLEAAVAMKDAAAAQPVLQWLEESGIEDRYLVGLAQRLKGQRK
jgi:tetratricopeptide (TPR) repeat protein